MSLVLKIIIWLLLILGVLILMGFLGTMVFAFCFMVNDKEDTEDTEDTDNGNDRWQIENNYKEEEK